MIKTVEEIAKIIDLGIECDHTTIEIARQIVLEISNEINYLKLDKNTYMKGMIENRKIVIKQEKQIKSLEKEFKEFRVEIANYATDNFPPESGHNVDLNRLAREWTK